MKTYKDVNNSSTLKVNSIYYGYRVLPLLQNTLNEILNILNENTIRKK